MHSIDIGKPKAFDVIDVFPCSKAERRYSDVIPDDTS
jgi:hypothetical protein